MPAELTSLREFINAVGLPVAMLVAFGWWILRQDRRSERREEEHKAERKEHTAAHLGVLEKLSGAVNTLGESTRELHREQSEARKALDRLIERISTRAAGSAGLVTLWFIFLGLVMLCSVADCVTTEKVKTSAAETVKAAEQTHEKAHEEQHEQSARAVAAVKTQGPRHEVAHWRHTTPAGDVYELDRTRDTGSTRAETHEQEAQQSAAAADEQKDRAAQVEGAKLVTGETDKKTEPGLFGGFSWVLVVAVVAGYLVLSHPSVVGAAVGWIGAAVCRLGKFVIAAVRRIFTRG